MAGVPGVTEALFQARQLALAEERNKFSPTPMLYSCALCGKEYRSSKAHAQHMKSRAHVMKASQESTASTAGITVIKPLIDCVPNKSALLTKAQLVREDYRESEENEDEWVEVNPDEEVDMVYESLSNLHVDEHASNADGDMDEIEKLDPSCCFMCDLKHDNIENCMVHMHKKHGFFIPDIEYLKYPRGLLTYVGLKVLSVMA